MAGLPPASSATTSPPPRFAAEAPRRTRLAGGTVRAKPSRLRLRKLNQAPSAAAATIPLAIRRRDSARESLPLASPRLARRPREGACGKRPSATQQRERVDSAPSSTEMLAHFTKLRRHTRSSKTASPVPLARERRREVFLAAVARRSSRGQYPVNLCDPPFGQCGPRVSVF